MAVTYAVITALMDDAVSALADADYITARDKAVAAQGVLSVLPNTTRNSSGGGSDGLNWDRVALSKFIDTCNRLAAASLGVRVSKSVSQPLQVDGVVQLGVW